MAILTTGPIVNTPVNGVRPTQTITIKIVNNDPVNTSTVLFEGYYLNGTRTLYVLEAFPVGPNEVITHNNYANLDGYEFLFTIGDDTAGQTEISVWGKNADGELVDAHRLVSSEVKY
ncbi:hypothetical protein [Paenibacillus agri]|uniref:Uncharacterized protein n=1 Tax=Paenibacillus agri TaxID=2744309 RepID=A0A850EJJ7_9BACL|nr:hypothetical protein [Paenibacillus agri]NUU60546.1 hypothetical protein [Paenibacillus agri]